MSQTERLRVSVIIVNWNTQQMLADCLSSVFAEAPSVSMQVIVIDNGSTDGSCQMCRSRFPQVELIENTDNVGFARAMNQGFAVARGDYSLMLNSDTVVLDGAIGKSIAFADGRPEAGIVGCRLLNPDRSFQDSAFRFPGLLGLFLNAVHLSQAFRHNYVLNWDRYGFQEWSEPREVDCVMGSFMLIRRAVLEEVGLLDTDYFMYGEETDFAFRARKAGWKTFYFPGAETIHVRGGSAKDGAGRAWAYHACWRGQLLFLCKQRGLLTGYAGNVIVASFLVPRVVCWFAADALNSLRRRMPLQPQRLLRACSFGFHFRALLQPRLLTQQWRR